MTAIPAVMGVGLMKKYQALFQRIQTGIKSGILKDGERLPSIREEAAMSGVSVNTVIAAYNILADEGLIRARERGGYYVQAGMLALTEEGIGEAVSTSQRYTATARETGERLDQLYERLAHIDAGFAYAAPGLDILPADHLCQAAAGLGGSWMTYGHPEGDLSLRRRIAIAYQESDGTASPDDIIITNGATEALAIVLRTLLHPGDTVALESPTYMQFFRQMAPLGVKLVEIPMVKSGMNLEILEQELNRQRIRMIITQPNIQNPTGITMDDRSKEKLVSLAEIHGVYLVQDDVYGDLFFGSFRPRNLLSYSDYRGLILVSSLSKTVSPGLRIGWIRCRNNTRLLVEEKLRSSMETSRAAQAVAACFIGTAAHRRHIQTMRNALKLRIDDYIQRLSEILPQGSYVRRPSGGCLLWIAFPPDIDGARVFERSAGKGLICAPGDLFSASRRFNNYIRLNAGRKLTRERSEALGVLKEAARLDR